MIWASHWREEDRLQKCFASSLALLNSEIDIQDSLTISRVTISRPFRLIVPMLRQILNEVERCQPATWVTRKHEVSYVLSCALPGRRPLFINSLSASATLKSVSYTRLRSLVHVNPATHRIRTSRWCKMNWIQRWLDFPTLMYPQKARGGAIFLLFMQASFGACLMNPCEVVGASGSRTEMAVPMSITQFDYYFRRSSSLRWDRTHIAFFPFFPFFIFVLYSTSISSPYFWRILRL